MEEWKLETRTCIAKNCNATFRVSENSPQVFCGKNCQQDSDKKSKVNFMRGNKAFGRKVVKKKMEYICGINYNE